MSRLIACCTAFVLMYHSVIADGNFKISGTFSNPVPGPVTISIDKSWLNLNPEVFRVTTRNGIFDTTFSLDRNRIVEIRYGADRIPLYAEPGFDISFQFSASPAPSLQLSGKGAEENSFLQKFFTQFAKEFNDSISYATMLTKGIDAYESEIFMERRAMLEYMKGNQQSSAFSPDFFSFIQDQIFYRYWHLLLAWPVINANNNPKVMTVQEIPEVMLKELPSVVLNNNKSLISNSYRDFVMYYIVYFTSKANNFNKFQDPSTSADRKLAVATDKLESSVYTYWLARFTLEECGRIASYMRTKLLHALKEANVSGSLYESVKAYVESQPVGENTAGTGKGTGATSAPDRDQIGLTDLDGKPVSLDDFKGKVVYIDFWASWCGPCRMMMPYSKHLHDQLTDKEKKNILFLYISIDAKPEAWKKGIEDNHIEGINVISPGNWASKVCKYFQINSIPRYMIMNRKGEIVNYNANRPSDPSVLEALRKLAAE